MNAELLLQHFDHISEAPDAIPRLRRFILDLAVRGKLVPQDPNDEPASELLKRIQAEKVRLVGADNMKRQANLFQVEEAEVPFETPTSWQWVRLIDVLTKLTDGTHHSPTNLTEGAFKYVTAKNIKPEGISLSDISYVANDVHHEIYSRCNPEKGDILYIKDGATTGVVTINNLDEPFSMLSSVALLKLSSGVYNRLVVEFLRSPFFYMQMRGFMKGAAITRVTLKRMAPALIPLPPLAEQHRIVAKVDELMALCDELEAAKTECEQSRDRLVAASLHRLNQPEDVGEANTLEAFRDHARFTFNHLPRLTNRPAHIKQLRQTILNLAVRGKVVPQDPNDEPASELLKRIAVEKARLRKEGMITDEKALLTVLSTELPFCIPSAWQWARFIDYAIGISTGPFGSILHQSDYVDGGVPLVNPSHMVNGRIVPEQNITVSCETAERLSVYKLRDGDIVMARRGEIGRAAVVYKREDGWLCGTGSFFLRFTEEACREYLMVLLRCQFVRKYLAGEAVGITMVNLNHGILKRMPLPIPPLAEQHRIVAKVDELMALCDQLEAQLTATEADSRRLLEAVLHEALSPALQEAT